MTINEITNECSDINSSAERTGTCQHSDRAMVLSNTPAVSRNATKAAERNADPSQNPGGQGLVKTMLMLARRISPKAGRGRGSLGICAGIGKLWALRLMPLVPPLELS